MKKHSTIQLHKNFILLHDFQYGKENLKEWVKKDNSYTGIYHTDFNQLFEIICLIGNKTEFELVMHYNSCYWNKFGENPLSEKEFGGYENIKNIYKAVVSFVKWYNKNNK